MKLPEKASGSRRRSDKCFPVSQQKLGERLIVLVCVHKSNWISCSRLKRRPFSLEKRVNKSMLLLLYSSTAGSTRTTSGLLLRHVPPSGHLSPRWWRWTCRQTHTGALKAFKKKQKKHFMLVKEQIFSVTLTSVPSLQCQTMPSTRPSRLSWNQACSCWKSTGGGFLIRRLPCDTRQWTGCFLLPSPVERKITTIIIKTFFMLLFLSETSWLQTFCL